MTTLSHEPSTLRRTRVWRESVEIWASLAITVMWVAVTLVSLFGPDIRSFDVSGTTTVVPSGVALGLFATIGSWAVAKHAFGRKPSDS